MARRRRKVTVAVGPVRVSYEWLGFMSGGTPANLDTSVQHELIPPSGASSVLDLEFTVLRCVGQLSFNMQSGVVAPVGVGAMIQKVTVGGDQVIDNIVNPLTTDPDDFDDRGIMWWWVAHQVGPHTPIADVDSVSVVVPFDVRTKRKMSKRDTLVLRVDAGTTAVSRVAVQCRTLIRTY